MLHFFDFVDACVLGGNIVGVADFGFGVVQNIRLEGSSFFAQHSFKRNFGVMQGFFNCFTCMLCKLRIF